MSVQFQYLHEETVEDIVMSALQSQGGGPYTGQELKTAAEQLQLLLFELNNKQVPLSFLEQTTQTLTAGVTEYTLDPKFKDVESMVAYDSGGRELRVNRMGLFEFDGIAAKDQTGERPLQYTTHKQQDSVVVKIWPKPKDASWTLKFWGFLRTPDVLLYTTKIKMPKEFRPVVQFGLMYNYGLVKPGGLADEAALAKHQIIGQKYMELLGDALKDDRERVPLRIRHGYSYSG